MNTAFARDSILWWLGIIAGIVTYLMNAPAPDEWLYHDWLKALGMIVALISAKLSSSPRPSVKDIEWTAQNIDRRTTSV